jgi:hypothetical protein
MKKTILATLAAAGALATIAAPAAAHPYRHQGEVQSSYRDHGGAHPGRYGTLADGAASRLDGALRSGVLSRSEARELRNELRDFARLEDQFGRGGYSYAERRTLDKRLDDLMYHIRLASNDRDHTPRYGAGYYR